MTRRRWLVAYDIRDEVRLRKVHDIVRCLGERLQYSVFLCDLDPIEKLGLLEQLNRVLHHTVDSVALIDLGEPGRATAARIEFIGSSLPLPSQGPTVV